MRIFLVVVLSLLALAATPARADEAAPLHACETLKSLDLSGVADQPAHVERAAPSAFNGAEVCAVAGYVEPAVRFLVRLPLQDWDGRFLQAGCGGLCGRIPDEFAQVHGCPSFESGHMAVAATDMGHEGPGPEFGDDPQLRADFAWRGVHVTAEVAKALIQAFYGKPAAHAYFLGCSDGGREALIEAERFPDDFDGVAAGSPAMNFLIQNTFYHGWNATSNTGPDGKPILTAPDLAVLHRAALAACGAVEGVIEDPLRCAFDPAAAACKTRESADCLSAELAWEGVFAPKAGSAFIFGRVIAGGAIQHLAFAPGAGQGLRLEDLRYDRETYEQLLPQHALYDATTPDLGPFAQRGGKLILWHGDWDPHISPTNSILFYDNAVAALGPQQDTIRFFLVPGLYHCEGGIGPVRFDVLSPMLDWVENGKAPDKLIARDDKTAQVVFPYPMLAHYDGKGDRADPTSWTPTPPPAPFKVREWIGEGLFRAGD
jgi:feruloyl esterase